MKNLHNFLSELSKCPICDKKVFTEMIITFDAYSHRNAVPFKLNIVYIRNQANGSFNFVKYRDDDDRQYDPGFDRAANEVTVLKDGSFMFASNIFQPSSYSVFGRCDADHFIIETNEVYLNSKVEEHRKIKVLREELMIKNYKIINDYRAGKTNIYVDDTWPAKLTIKLTPAYNIKRSSASDIISKIESLLILV